MATTAWIRRLWVLPLTATLGAGLGVGDLGAQARPGSLRIAFVAKSLSNPVFQAAQRGAEDAARDLGHRHGVAIELRVLTPPREDGAAQAERVNQAVREGAQAILVSCSDAAVLTPAIDAAVAKGVPVMTFDSDAPASKRFAFYGVDDVQVGERVMTEVAQQLGGKGRVAILAGSALAPNMTRRAEAARKAAARFPEIQVVEVVTHAETPLDSASAVVAANARHADLAGWAMVGGWALFRSSKSLELMNDLERRGLKVVAVDALPDQLVYVEKGLVPVLWAQPIYLWGKLGVGTIVDKVVLGKTVPERMPMELVKVSGANLGAWSKDLKSWGFAGLPAEYLNRP